MEYVVTLTNTLQTNDHGASSITIEVAPSKDWLELARHFHPSSCSSLDHPLLKGMELRVLDLDQHVTLQQSLSPHDGHSHVSNMGGEPCVFSKRDLKSHRLRQKRP